MTGELEVAHYRISKSAWLKDEDHQVVETVGRRLRDMTGLNMDTAEELQVVNYGIGGHYEPHFDFARKDEINSFKNLGTGNRIATVLFYVKNPILRITEILIPFSSTDDRCSSRRCNSFPSYSFIVVA